MNLKLEGGVVSLILAVGEVEEESDYSKAGENHALYFAASARRHVQIYNRSSFCILTGTILASGSSSISQQTLENATHDKSTSQRQHKESSMFLRCTNMVTITAGSIETIRETCFSWLIIYSRQFHAFPKPCH